MAEKRILITSFPSFSALAPAVPIALQLRSAGHRVAFASGAGLREIVETEGFEYFDIGPEDFSVEELYQRDPGLKTLSGHELNDTVFDRYFFPIIAPTVRDLAGVVGKFKPDVLFADQIVHAAPIVHEMTGVPWATYMSGGFMYPSEDLAPVGSGFPPPRNEREKLFYRRLSQAGLGSGPILDKWDRAFNEIRAGFGLPPKQQIVVEISPQLVIAFVPGEFEYPRSDLPPQVHFLGPSLWDRPGTLGVPGSLEQIRARVRADKLVIFVTMGTTWNGYERIVGAFVEALAGFDAQVVVTVGRFNDTGWARALPSNFIVEKFIPHSLLFPLVDLVICHAGTHTIMGALSHGVPLVCLPTWGECLENAQRVHDRGVGIRIGNPMKFDTMESLVTPDNLRRAISEVLGDPRYIRNARRMQKVIGSCNAPANAASLLLELAESKKPVRRKREYWAA
jgi:MGT family glycosyltransferase